MEIVLLTGSIEQRENRKCDAEAHLSVSRQLTRSLARLWFSARSTLTSKNHKLNHYHNFQA